MAHTCYPSTWESGAGRLLRIQGQSRLHRKTLFFKKGRTRRAQRDNCVRALAAFSEDLCSVSSTPMVATILTPISRDLMPSSVFCTLQTPDMHVGCVCVCVCTCRPNTHTHKNKHLLFKKKKGCSTEVQRLLASSAFCYHLFHKFIMNSY